MIFMRKFLAAAFFVSILASCKHESKKQFEVSGVLTNSNSDKVYLEELPLGSGQRILVDSSPIDKSGKYSLHAKRSDEALFQLFLRNEEQPFALVINDASKIVVNADLSKRTDYEVEGSPASKSVKDFSLDVTSKWTELYTLGAHMDSMKRSGASDSLLLELNTKGRGLLGQLQEKISR